MGVTPPDDFDAGLVRRACRGDRASRATLLRELQDVWYRFAYSMLRDEHAARDAAQETGLRFLRGLGGFRGNSRLKTWSLGIALNVCREHTRKHTATPLPDEPLPGPGADPALQAVETEGLDRLRQAVNDLPERQREAVVLRYFEELTLQETADAMGCALGTAKATVSQALSRLRETRGVNP